MTRPRHFLENVRYLRRDFPGIRVCFYGHTHEQRVVEIDGERTCELGASAEARLDPRREYFVNPGSVDASRKRSDKRAELAIFDSTGMTVRFAQVPYDEQATEARAESAGYRIDRWRDRLYDVQRRLIGPRHEEANAP